MLNALIHGYYGKGNFGDDVLFCVTCELLRREWPQARIVVAGAAEMPPYLARLAGPVAAASPLGKDRSYDVIVHGGGGTFFDFRHGRWWMRLVNKAVLAAGGRPYVRLERVVRALARRPREHARVRLGWGIGVGTFTAASPTLRHRMPTLLDFDALMVRDTESVRNLAALGVRVLTEVGSDIAFLHPLWWRGVALRPPGAGPRPRLGVILRDWPVERPSVSRALAHTLASLGDEYDLTAFLFDASADGDTAARLAHLTPLTWDPERSSLTDFAGALAAMDLLVTTRAHGAICGAVVGIPSVLLEIEPKLRSVHEMLPRSTRLLASNASTDTVRAALRDLSRLDRAEIGREVEHNREKAQAGLDRLFELARATLSPAEAAAPLADRTGEAT